MMGMLVVGVFPYDVIQIIHNQLAVLLINNTSMAIVEKR